MTLDTGTVVPRSQISLGIEPSLRGSLAHLAKRRVLVIGLSVLLRLPVLNPIDHGVPAGTQLNGRWTSDRRPVFVWKRPGT